MAAPKRQALTDSPWFWAHAFSAGGLAAVMLLGPKVDQRQVQIERQDQGRQVAMSGEAARENLREASLDENSVISTRPLVIVLICVFLISGGMYWRGRRRERFPLKRSREPKDPNHGGGKQ